MKTSTEIASIARHVGERKAVEWCAEAGFDGWDFSMFAMANYNWQTQSCDPSDHPLCGKGYLQFARELRNIGESYGIRCNQSHAPFPVNCKGVRDLLPRALECTAQAGGEICVIHPDNHQIPFSMQIDYAPIIKALKEIGYSGWFTLEADKYLSAFDADSVFSGVKDLAASAQKLVQMWEGE